MAQNMFTYGSKRDEFTDEDAKREFERIEEELLDQMHQFELPEALMAENMMQLLDGVTPGVTQPARVINYKKEYTRFVAYAACFVLVIYGFARLVKHQNDIVAGNETAVAYSLTTAAMGAAPEAAYDAAASSTAAVPAETAAKESSEEEAEPAESSPAAVGAVSESGAYNAASENMLLMVNGVLYRSIGEAPNVEGRCGVMDGKITLTVDADSVPTQDGESNFGAGCEYQMSGENSVDVLIDGVWYRFVREN